MGVDLKFKKTTPEELLGSLNEVEFKHAPHSLELFCRIYRGLGRICSTPT